MTLLYCSTCGSEFRENYGTAEHPQCYRCWKYDHIENYDERDEEEEE